MKFYMIIALGIMVVLAGCASEELNCSDKNSDYKKYRLNAKGDVCELYKEINKDECGNGIPEDDETYCNCNSDVKNDVDIKDGGCSGSLSNYLEYACDSGINECVLKVTDNVKKMSKQVEVAEGSRFSFDAKVNYFEPFIMGGRHDFEVEFFVKEIMDTDSKKVRDIKLIKVDIVDKDDNVLATKRVSYDIDAKFEEFKFMLNNEAISIDSFDHIFKGIRIKTVVSYVEDTYSGGNLRRSEELTSEILEQFADKVTYIDATKEYIPPED